MAPKPLSLEFYSAISPISELSLRNIGNRQKSACSFIQTLVVISLEYLFNSILTFYQAVLSYGNLLYFTLTPDDFTREVKAPGIGPVKG